MAITIRTDANAKPEKLPSTNRASEVTQALPVSGDTMVISKTELSQIISSSVAAALAVQQPQATTKDENKDKSNNARLAIEQDYAVKQLANEQLAYDLTNGEKQYVSIPMVYKEFVGTTIPLTFNGCSISIPVDGKRYAIPVVFIPQLSQYLEYYDKKIATRNAVNGQPDGRGGIAQISQL